MPDLSVPTFRFCYVKMTLQVRLYPDDEQAAAFAATLAACNAAANHVAAVLHEQNPRTAYDLQALVYAEVKDSFGLSAQPAVRVVKKVYDAHKTRAALLRSGRLGRRGSRRYERVAGKPVGFRPDAAQPFDARCLSWQISPEGYEGTISIWTTHGRLKHIPFRGSSHQVEMLRRQKRIGEADLVHRDDTWFLYVTCDIPEPAITEPDGWVGVDLGIVNIAYTSEGESWSGGAVTFRRKKNAHLRSKLQAKQTKGAKRLLKKRRRKERRFVADTNHKIAHRIVAEAQRTGNGIAIEDLDGIRERARLRKPQRATLHSWAFSQLGQFLEYKAALVGVLFVRVDPRYTSQTCSQAVCGHRERANRSGERFVCRRCGTISHADHNAARNIASLGAMAWEAGQKSTVHSGPAA